ncbi:MAG: dihydrofolate reductase family protein [Eubacteriaceae bacterium]
MRRIILNMAVSLDGYISDENGRFDWIVGQEDNSINTREVFNFENFLESIDTVVMGSKSYEDCILSDLQTFEDQQVIVATSRKLEQKNQAEFISGDICDEILKLKELDGKDIWLFGGAGLTDSFIKEDIVDEYIIAIIPTILGNGRRLFKGDYPKIDLHLNQVSVNDDITVMTYSKKGVFYYGNSKRTTKRYYQRERY